MWAWLKAATTCCGIHRCICHMCRYRCRCCCCLCVSASKANAARGVGVADAWVQLNVAAATTDNRGWSSAFLQLPQLCLLPLATCLRATVACCRQLALHLIKLQPSAASRMCRIVPATVLCRMRFFFTWKSPHHNRIMRQVAAKRITMPKRKHY